MAEHNKLHKSENAIYLEFRVGPLHFCAPVAEVEIVISPPKMSVVPINAGVMTSCFNHQGHSITVIDLHSKFGLPFTFAKNRTHIILATVENELKGFWVDRALTIAPLSCFEKDISDSYPLNHAYFNFLLRNQEQVLQTSFLQLFKCQGSDLNWQPASEMDETVQPDKTAEAAEPAIAEPVIVEPANIEPVIIESVIIEPDITEDSKRKTDSENTQTEIADHVPASPASSQQSSVADVVASHSQSSVTSKQTERALDEHKLIPFVKRDSARRSAHPDHKHHAGVTMQANSALSVSPMQTHHSHVVSIKAHEDKVKQLAQQRLNNKPGKKLNTKIHQSAWLVTAILLIVAMGFAVDYQLHVSAMSEAGRTTGNASAETVPVDQSAIEKRHR